jgi:hypothetical protein
MKSVNNFPKPTENKYKYSVGKIETKISVKDKENRKVKFHAKQGNSDRHDETFKIKRRLDAVYQNYESKTTDWTLGFNALLLDNIDHRDIFPKALNASGSALMVCSKFWLLYFYLKLDKLTLDDFIKLFRNALDFLDFEKQFLLDEYTKLLERFNKDEIVVKINECKVMFKKIEKYEHLTKDDLKFLLQEPQYINMFKSQVGREKKIINDLILTELNKEEDINIQAAKEQKKIHDSVKEEDENITISKVEELNINEEKIEGINLGVVTKEGISQNRVIKEEDNASEIKEKDNTTSEIKEDDNITSEIKKMLETKKADIEEINHEEKKQYDHLNDDSYKIKAVTDQILSESRHDDNLLVKEPEKIVLQESVKQFSIMNLEIIYSFTFTYIPLHNAKKGYQQLIEYNKKECTISKSQAHNYTILDNTLVNAGFSG